LQVRRFLICKYRLLAYYIHIYKWCWLA
jgi:hypothetical protein